jgi:hypothetical protein
VSANKHETSRLHEEIITFGCSFSSYNRTNKALSFFYHALVQLFTCKRVVERTSALHLQFGDAEERLQLRSR